VSDFCVFISHSNTDSDIAENLVSILEKEQISCWIAPRDISPGDSWAESIANGIHECKILILLLSEQSNQSVQVIREVEHAVNQRKLLITIRLSEVSPSRAMGYFIGSQQWLDAFPNGFSSSLVSRLLHTIKTQLSDIALRKDSKPEEDQVSTTQKDTSAKYEFSIKDILRKLYELNGSKLILTVGAPPTALVYGKYTRFEMPPLTPTNVMDLCTSLMMQSQKDTFVQNRYISFRFGIKGVSRFSIMVHYQRGCWNAVIDVIPYSITGISDILPVQSVKQLLANRRGLVLIGGTTELIRGELIHSCVAYIGKNYDRLICTIESQISFVHHHDKCTIMQIELQSDSTSFATAFSSAMELKPDILTLDYVEDPVVIQNIVDYSKYQGVCMAALSKDGISYNIEKSISTLLQKCSSYANPEYILSSVIAIATLDVVWSEKGEKIYLPNLLILDDEVHCSLLNSLESNTLEEAVRSYQYSRNNALLHHYSMGRLSREEAISFSMEPSSLVAMLDSKKV